MSLSAKAPFRAGVSNPFSQAIGFFAIERAELGLKVQNRQQSTKTDKLPNHHAEFDDLFVTKMLMQPIKKIIVDTVVI